MGRSCGAGTRSKNTGTGCLFPAHVKRCLSKLRQKITANLHRGGSWGLCLYRVLETSLRTTSKRSDSAASVITPVMFTLPSGHISSSGTFQGTCKMNWKLSAAQCSRAQQMGCRKRGGNCTSRLQNESCLCHPEEHCCCHPHLPPSHILTAFIQKLLLSILNHSGAGRHGTVCQVGVHSFSAVTKCPSPPSHPALLWGMLKHNWAGGTGNHAETCP